MNIVNVTITDTKLMELAQCSQRMTEYADENDGLLIIAMNSKENVLVRLKLDKSCIRSSLKKAAAFNSS
jgi:hypothetical protein